MTQRARAAFVVIIALIGSPTIAEAGVERSGGYSYVTKTQKLRAGESKVLAAPCPEGTRVLSGGGYNTGGVDTAVMRHSYPLDTGDRNRKPDEGWRVLWTTKTRVDITTHAICADMKVEYDQIRRTLDAGATLDGGHFCDDKDLYAVGGGSSGPARATETKNFLFGGLASLWKSVVEQDAGPESKFRVFVVCVRPQPTVATATESLPAGTQQGNSAECPPGTRIVGGGTASSTPAQGSDRQVLIAASRPIGEGATGSDGWQSYYDNYTDATDYSYFVQALCLPPLG